MHRMQRMLQCECVQNELHDSGSYNDEKTKKGRASLNADDLIKNKNLTNELTFIRILKKSYKYAYICNILIFQDIFETVTFIHIYTNTAQTFVT